MRLRFRIVLRMLSIAAISGGISALIGGYLLWRNLNQEAQNRVRQDLNAAREFYNQRLDAMGDALRYTVLSEGFIQAVAKRDMSFVAARLQAVRKSAGADALCVTDTEGRAIRNAERAGPADGPVVCDRLHALALERMDVVTGTALVPMRALEQEAPALAERARIRIQPTARATPSERTDLDSGMMLCAAAPVRGTDGKAIGVLRAGILLNRNYDLVDRVQNTVFHDEKYQGKLLGTATVFQGDVRISTNVLEEDGSRAIGTRVSSEVYDCVLREGKTWVGPAWVVNDWYISAYAPIADADGNAIGILYVGVLQRKFDEVLWGTFTTFALVTLLVLLATGVVAWTLADSIARPISSLAAASADIAQGNFSRTLPQKSADEIGLLTHSFNTMARSLKERDELLKEQTRLQLTRTERMASIGRLAAGVAHEINNPLTGVLTFAHMLRKNAPEGSETRGDADTIIEATMRCREIVRGLLNFSRQNEPQKALSDLNDVLKRALHLMQNQARINRVDIVEEYDPSLPNLVIDPHQIQEVAVNMVVNAIDAMPDGGTVTVRTRKVEDGKAEWAEFEIEDKGCGIPRENLDRIFDPFFTTKQTGKGTGLGLAVSYGIVAEHGGQIGVSSEMGRGTKMTVRLPIAMKEQRDEQQGADLGD